MQPSGAVTKVRAAEPPVLSLSSNVLQGKEKPSVFLQDAQEHQGRAASLFTALYNQPSAPGVGGKRKRPQFTLL